MAVIKSSEWIFHPHLSMCAEGGGGWGGQMETERVIEREREKQSAQERVFF